IMTRSTEVMPATPATETMTSAQSRWTCLKALETPALTSISSYFTMPVSTATTAIYSTVQIKSDATMPIGTSRCGFTASSAWVETGAFRNAFDEDDGHDEDDEHRGQIDQCVFMVLQFGLGGRVANRAEYDLDIFGLFFTGQLALAGNDPINARGHLLGAVGPQG